MTKDTRARIQAALDEVEAELIDAYAEFPDMRSAHEGVATVNEEFIEFRDAAYWPHRFPAGAEEKEATQLAAMAVRYLVDICYNEEAPR